MILYLFPLAGAAILAPLVLALFSASLVTLFLLGETTWQVLFQQGEQRPLMQAGLYGAAFFAIVLAGEPPGGEADPAGRAGGRARHRPADRSRRSTRS